MALRATAVVASGLVATVLSSCGSGNGAPSIPAPSSRHAASAQAASSKATKPASRIVITIRNFAFHPDQAVVSPGATIVVHNADPVTHTLTADAGDSAHFNTGDIPAGHTVVIRAPATPGKYPYLCLIHQFMTGVIIVR
jgi:plastocyanin